MKIINPGVLSGDQWWVGERIVCTHCGLEAELEAKDAGKVVNVGMGNSGDRCAYVRCPTEGCEKAISFFSS